MAKLRKYGQVSRKERRKDAEERQKDYESLTPQQKLDKLPPTGSNKQRTRLEHLIKFGRKKGQSETPSNTQKRKNDKPSRRERWEERNQE
jgi:hypothetical protein|tara:strand:- start:2898 stop:3167 length:270 start_codon:yes stop_codon:yes gene_type:complete